MPSNSQQVDPKTPAQVRAFVADLPKMDSLAEILESRRGGSFSRAHVIELALAALERELSAEAAKAVA